LGQAQTTKIACKERLNNFVIRRKENMREINKRGLLIVIVSLCITFPLLGGGKQEKEAEPRKIEIWHTYSDAEVKVFDEETIPAFEAAHPGIKVVSTKMPYDGLKQQVIAGVAGDAVPDLMRMDIIWVPEFAKQGALTAVSDKNEFGAIQANLLPGPMRTNYYNGKYYGLPLNTNTKVAIYNRSALTSLGAQPPKTFEELVALAERFKGPEKWGLGVGGTSTWGQLPWFWSLGGRLTDDNYTRALGYLDSSGSIEALQTMVDLNRKGLIGPSLLGAEPNTWAGIQEGNYLMIDDGPWFYSILGQEAYEKTVWEQFPKGKGGSVSVVGGENLVIFKGARHPEEAWTLMQYLLTDEPQLRMARTGLIPTTKSAGGNPELEDNELVQIYVKQLQTARPRTPHPNWEKISEAVGLAFESAYREKGTAERLLRETAQEIDGYLKD